MNYKPLQDAVSYLSRMYDRAKDIAINSLFPPSGLEFAVAGMPNMPMKDFPANPSKDLTSKTDHILESRAYAIKSVNKEGKRIRVERDDGRTTYLNPDSARHSADSYVRKKLTELGIATTSAEVKRIAKRLTGKSNKRRN